MDQAHFCFTNIDNICVELMRSYSLRFHFETPLANHREYDILNKIVLFVKTGVLAASIKELQVKYL